MQKKHYTRPTITKHQVGVMNKFGNTQHNNIKEEIGGAKVDQLLEDYGSPLFVFEEKALRNQYRKISSEFELRYPNVQFSWSYKTNYLGAICQVLHQEGEIAEVVSLFEYEKARNLGIQGKDIIFNGPHKGEDGLTRAFEEEAIVNIDNFDELYLAEKVAKKLGRKVAVGLRINVDTGMKPAWSRFGLNYESGQAYEAAARIHKSEHLTLRGIHTHISTFILDPQIYAKATVKVIALLNQVEDDFGFVIEYVDLGGGLPSKSKLKGSYLPPDVSIPPYEDYAEAICSTLLKNLRPGSYPKLYMESGRAMVDESGSLVTSVISRVKQPDGTNGYTLDGGVNIMYTATWYNYQITPTRYIPEPPEMCKLYGPLCMNIDVVSESSYLPPMNVGDSLVLWPMGAYNVTQWMQFIAYRPAVVMIMEDGTSEIIRKREELENVISPEVIPSKLRAPVKFD